MESDQKPIVYRERDHTYYRASGLTTCPRAFIYARQGHPSAVPPSLEEAFKFGRDHEDEVVEMLIRRGYNVHDRQRELTLSITPTVSIIGHIDGIVTSFKSAPHPYAILEIKCLNHENTEKFLNDPLHFPAYIAQVSSYYYAALESPTYPEGIPVETILFAIYDKDEKELHTTLFHPVNNSRLALVDLIQEREVAWLDYQSADQMPTCQTKTFCPYWQLHEDEVIDDPELEANCISLTSIQHRMEALARLETIVKTRIKTHLSESSVTKGRVGQFKFSYSEFTSKRLDTRAAAAYLKSIQHYSEFVKETASTRLEVKVVEDV